MTPVTEKCVTGVILCIVREEIRAQVPENYQIEHMDCFWCEIISGELELKEAEAAQWLTKESLDSVAWLPADITIIEKIRNAL